MWAIWAKRTQDLKSRQNTKKLSNLITLVPRDVL